MFFLLPFFLFFLPRRLTGTQAIIQDARVWMFSDAQNKVYFFSSIFMLEADNLETETLHFK